MLTQHYPEESPLHAAARCGDVVAIGRLLDSGVDVDERGFTVSYEGDGARCWTALMVAAGSDAGASVETLRYLVLRGADVRVVDWRGDTALSYAAKARGTDPDRTARLAFLLDAMESVVGASIDVGQTLLRWACAVPDPGRVRLLLERGAPAEVEVMTDPAPDTVEFPYGAGRVMEKLPLGPWRCVERPLDVAARAGCAECVRLLLDAGARADMRDRDGSSALHEVGSYAAARLLIEAGADPTWRRENGRDAIDDQIGLFSCMHPVDRPPDWPGAMRAMLEAGVDPNRSSESWTRLERAAFDRNVDAVEALLAFGADPDPPGDGGGPLHRAAWHWESRDAAENEATDRIIRALVAAGADVNRRGPHGRTPLHEAVLGDSSSPTAVRALLACGADVTAEDDGGRRPIAYVDDCFKEEWREAVRALLEAG